MLILSPFKERNVACVYYAACVCLLGVQYIAMPPPAHANESGDWLLQSIVQCIFLHILFPVIRERLLCYFTVFIDIKNSFIDINKSVHLLISRIHLWIELQSSIY